MTGPERGSAKFAGSGGAGDGVPDLDGATGSEWVPPTWEQVVRQHSTRVYRLAFRLSGNAQDAEDLTQETFVRVFKSLANYTPGTFEGWLHRITTNLFLDMVRRRARIRFDALPEDSDRLPGGERSPEQVFSDTHFESDVQAALDSLPADFRVAVVLCDIEGLTYEEIAATLGIKLGTVRSRIHRGRLQLREALRHRAPRRTTAPAAPAVEAKQAVPTAPTPPATVATVTPLGPRAAASTGSSGSTGSVGSVGSTGSASSSVAVSGPAAPVDAYTDMEADTDTVRVTPGVAEGSAS